MKRNFRKILLTVFAVTSLVMILAFSSSAKEYKSGNFIYNVGSKYAVLVEYTGKSKSVKIPSKVKDVPVTRVGEWAFSDNKTMQSVTIPSTVTRIGEAAFNNCTALKKVSLPKNLKTISASAFWYCTGLKQIFIYENVSSIGKNAFKGCSNATIYVVKGTFAEKHISSLEDTKMAYRYMTSLKFDKSSLSLQKGSSQQLTYKVSPENVYNKKVTYKSSNEKIATVSADGIVKAVSYGTAVITCTAKDGSKKVSSCTVKVVPQNVSGLKTSSVTTKSYTLKWSKVDGATGYLIKKYDTAKKEWSTLGKTTKTSWSFKNLKPGMSTRYAVKAYTVVGRTTYYSPAYKYLTAKTLSPDKVTGLTAVPGSSSVTLTWNDIDDATGYIVYIYDKSKNEYYQKADVSSSIAEIGSLKSSTPYSFAVKAYFKNESDTAYSKYYSEICSVTTLPGAVKGFSLIEDYTTAESVTLAWTKLSDCGGYIIYLYDAKTKEYNPYHTIKNNEITIFTATGLNPDTVYYFKIRAYGTDEANIGELSDKLRTRTLKNLINEKNGLQHFTEALNNTKNSTEDFTIIKQCTITDRNAPDSIIYDGILDEIAVSYSKSYSIVSGAESLTLVPATTLIAPLGKDCALEGSMIKENSMTVSPDGNGYNISFELITEDTEASATSNVAEIPDWKKIEEKNSSFKLLTCTYEGTEIVAKIRDGKLDHITTKVPMTVTFIYDNKGYSFTETVEYKYFFIRN